jgi:hypothetical protein
MESARRLASRRAGGDNRGMALIGGMPAPVPFDVPFRTSGTSAEMRLQAISFFLLALLLCILAVWGLWNYVRRDLTWLPRLSFGRALAGVILWGLLFFIVLTMISGARELMTPGAWKKDGLTYKLADDLAAANESREARRRHLEQLRTALWHFAATHGGRFPAPDDKTLAPELWQVPDGAGLRYLYTPGLSASDAPDLLAFEPQLNGDRRWALLTNGSIVEFTSDEIAARRKPESGR